MHLMDELNDVKRHLEAQNLVTTRYSSHVSFLPAIDRGSYPANFPTAMQLLNFPPPRRVVTMNPEMKIKDIAEVIYERSMHPIGIL